MQVTIHDAESQLARLIDAAERGEEVVILRRDKPVARIVAEQRPAASKRTLGFLAHVPVQLEGFFDRELEDAIARDFEETKDGGESFENSH